MLEEKSMQKNLQVFNRDMIKYIAMVTMLLNHVAHFLLPSTLLREVFEDIGYFTAPVMCYFLVEGYAYTRSKMKYGLRLALFAVISQIPFYLYFRFSMLNMFFTLLCCFLILVAREKIKNPFLQGVVCMVLVVVSCVGDWPFLAALLTYLLSSSRGDKKKMMQDYVVLALLFAFFNGLNYQGWGLSMTKIILRSAVSCLGIIAAGIAVLYLYSGKRAEHGRNFSKWFFYIFYPAHLFILYLVSVVMGLTVY